MLFNVSERKGILLLLLLIICLVVLPRQFRQTEYDLFLLNDTLIPIKDTIIPIKKALFTRKIYTTPIKKVELNSTDSTSLDALPGIGPYYASKIIRYRKQLGGYHTVKQLKELNMKYFNVDSLAHLFTVDSNLIIKQDLNNMSFKEIIRHPYLEYEDVKLIFNAKRQHQIISFTILQEKKILPAYILKKIKPYFK